MQQSPIRSILTEIATTSSTNAKLAILEQYKDTPLLKEFFFNCMSRMQKFYIKQIPAYTYDGVVGFTFEEALELLGDLTSRKKTGHDAIFHLKCILTALHPDDAYLIERIIQKDAKIGMGTTQVNKVYPKLIKDTPYMGAKPFNMKDITKLFDSAKKKGNPVIMDIKMDGRYANVIISDGNVELESRQGEPNNFIDAKFAIELATLPDGVLNGELTIPSISRYISNGLIASIVDITKKGCNTSDILSFNKGCEYGTFEEVLDMITFTTWDRITLEEYSNCHSSMPYYERKIILTDMLLNASLGGGNSNVHLIKSKSVTSIQEALEFFTEVVEEGEEGLIAKAFDGEWKDGKPSTQLKFKKEVHVDLEIVSFNYGTPGTKNENWISSINVKSSCGLLNTSPGGLSEDKMKWVTANQDSLAGTILQVKCNGVSHNSKGQYALLHPVCDEFRTDKSVANTLAECLDIDRMALELK